jgi:hypothetical protein
VNQTNSNEFGAIRVIVKGSFDPCVGANAAAVEVPQRRGGLFSSELSSASRGLWYPSSQGVEVTKAW